MSLNWSLHDCCISSYLKGTDDWRLLLGCRVLVVSGHREWIENDETVKEKYNLNILGCLSKCRYLYI